MEPTEGFGYFTAIVEAGSISAASRTLGMPRATLSRRLLELEASLGVKLLHRSTRRLVPTPAGEALYRRAVQIMNDAREARDAVRRLDGVPRGLLRISSLPGVGGDMMSPLVLAYMERYPETEVEVIATSRITDLIGEGIDVAIRAGAVRQPDLIARKVGQTDVFPVASPGYVEAHGLPMSPDELADHACLVGFEGSETPHRLWPLREGNGAVPVSGRLASNDLFLLCAAAEAGKGIALLPGLLTQPLVLEGRLVPVLEDQIGLTSPMSLVYASREFMDPKVRAFLDMAVEHFHMLFREGIPMQRPVQAS